jgi:hypothetical protein
MLTAQLVYISSIVGGVCYNGISVECGYMRRTRCTRWYWLLLLLINCSLSLLITMTANSFLQLAKTRHKTPLSNLFSQDGLTNTCCDLPGESNIEYWMVIDYHWWLGSSARLSYIYNVRLHPHQRRYVYVPHSYNGRHYWPRLPNDILSL